jgi:hypothetical protein
LTDDVLPGDNTEATNVVPVAPQLTVDTVDEPNVNEGRSTVTVSPGSRYTLSLKMNSTMDGADVNGRDSTTADCNTIE